MVGGKWEAPAYKIIRKIPFIPKETEIDQLIAGCSKRMATFLQLLKETGARCGEIWQLNWTDIDFESKVVNITPEKNSNPRVAHLSNKLLEMLQQLPKNYGEQSILTSKNASRQLCSKLPTTTQTNRKQNTKPKTAENSLPHIQILERHHALPRNQRHVLRNATLRPQKHHKTHSYTSNSKKHSSKAKTNTSQK